MMNPFGHPILKESALVVVSLCLNCLMTAFFISGITFDSYHHHLPSLIDA
jgi:hypothetical protein